MVSPWVRARSLSKHAHFVVVNRRSKRRVPWKSSRNLGGEEEVATCDCAKFLSLSFFFINPRVFHEKENSRVSHFVTTGFRFGFKGRGGSWRTLWNEVGERWEQRFFASFRVRRDIMLLLGRSWYRRRGINSFITKNKGESIGRNRMYYYFFLHIYHL